MTTQNIIIGIVIALAAMYLVRWFYRKVRGFCNCGCGSGGSSGGSSSKKIKPTRASLTIGGKEITRSSH
jgi:hypothetical protein